jgi:hypothetical protein
MENSKHTEGEWKAFSPTSNRLYNVPIGTDDITVAIVFTEIEEKTWRANAKLIAASPDLLEALIEVRKHMTAHIPEKVFDLIDKAIDKATK